MFGKVRFRVPILIAPELTMLPGEKLGWRGGRDDGLATPTLTLHGPILCVYVLCVSIPDLWPDPQSRHVQPALGCPG